MTYDTTFEGHFSIVPPLQAPHLQYLVAFQESRRMKRNADVIANLPDPLRQAVALPVGIEGGYFVAGYLNDSFGLGIIEKNFPPLGQPSIWCPWLPDQDGGVLEWDGGNDARAYGEWLVYLIEHFLAPWGYNLNGRVTWQGDNDQDIGTLIVVNNVVTMREGEIIDLAQ